MMSLFLKILFALLIYFIIPSAFAFENLVYTWRGFPDNVAEGNIAISDLEAHASQIDTLSSQAYHVDETGLVYGSMNPEMVQIAKTHHIKLLPLVGNIDFDRTRVHIFLNDKAAQDRAIQSILQLCKQNNYAGVQIDFEGMAYTDRAAFTNFFQNIATVLHQNNFEVAIAIIPTLTADAPSTDYLNGRYKGFSGVYDYKALGESSDLVTLMTYDQHGAITPPGPVSGTTWCEAIIQYALKYIPPGKISLGIPLHSNYWYTGKDVIPDDQTNSNNAAPNPIHVVETDLSYPETMRILKDKGVTLRWDNEDQVPYVFYTNHFLYEYIFAENADSFKAKLALVKKYKLRGISSWVLGEEDPKMWEVLAKEIK